MMTGPVDRLTLEFLDWVARCPRTYAEAMEAWRTTCPRMTVWEDALLAGLIRVERADEAAGDKMVALTDSGRTALAARSAAEAR
jgi:hypothetical protein